MQDATTRPTQMTRETVAELPLCGMTGSFPGSLIGLAAPRSRNEPS